MSAIIYCRTASTIGSRPDQAALEQEKLCRDFAETEGYEVTNVFFDLGVSGNSKDRHGFQALLNFLRQRPKPVTVLVSSVDRIARDLGVLQELVDKLTDMGAPLTIADKEFHKGL
ncbi:MAG: recombinase family protein [Bdellovibrionales bacterium]